MKNKKALSHVEIMISFVIFIGFLIFFYAIIEPAIKGPQSSDNVLQDLEENFLKQISEEVSVYNLTLNWDETNPGACVAGSCIKIDTPVNKNASVIEGKQSLDYYSDYSYISIWCGNGNCEDEDKFTIYYADSFSMTKKDACQWGIGSGCYTRKFLKKRVYIFESNIETLKNIYLGIADSYEQLKEELMIPAKYDFWFDFWDESKTSKFTPEWTSPDIPENVNTYVSEIPITYISKEEQDPESKKDGFLIIKMWG